MGRRSEELGLGLEARQRYREEGSGQRWAQRPRQREERTPVRIADLRGRRLRMWRRSTSGSSERRSTSSFQVDEEEGVAGEGEEHSSRSGNKSGHIRPRFAIIPLLSLSLSLSLSRFLLPSSVFLFSSLPSPVFSLSLSFRLASPRVIWSYGFLRCYFSCVFFFFLFI